MGQVDICDWLRNFLSDGPHDSEEVKLAARAAGFTRGDLKEARQICGLETTNNWRYGHTATKWYWSLPEATE